MWYLIHVFVDDKHHESAYLTDEDWTQISKALPKTIEGIDINYATVSDFITVLAAGYLAYGNQHSPQNFGISLNDGPTVAYGSEQMLVEFLGKPGAIKAAYVNLKPIQNE